ncbi:MAG: SRPBCC family protein [Actinomycetota bacterium]|nr:SRPBCC family protein [Actinomycetota bacterium]
MKLTNEFTVAVPIERAWETLLDIERVAGFLPGAKIESRADEDGVYRGSMRVKVGPMVVNYEGTARLVNADEHEHVADIAVQARDTKGQGTASAVIRNRLVAQDDGTRVIAETDLSITGRQAQFGRGIMQDVAGRMLDDFARRFERYLLEGDAATAEAQNGAPPDAREPANEWPAPQPSTEVSDGGAPLDLGSVVIRTPAVQRALAALAGLALAAFFLLGRRRRS